MQEHRTHARRARTAVAIMLLCMAVRGIVSCAGATAPRKADDLRIALLCNTNPESPFGRLSPKVSATFDRIKKENPLFMVHLGNMIYGGHEWMGIKASDISGQFNEFFAASARARTILYTTRGALDGFNDSPEPYILHSGRQNYYSFNYGNCHFIVLDTSDPEPCHVSEKQLQWLTLDLKRYRDCPAIFVIAHHPLLPPRAVRLAENGICADGGRVMALLSKYPVKAVISAGTAVNNNEYRDGVRHIIAGCGGFNKSDAMSRAYNYYMLEYAGGVVTVSGQRLDP